MSPARLVAAYRVPRRAVSARLEGLVRVLGDGVAASLTSHAAAGLLGMVVQTFAVRHPGPERYGDSVPLLTSCGVVAGALATLWRHGI